MIYGSFAICTGCWLSYAIVIFVWVTLFNINIYLKDETSYKHKKGWSDYQHNSYLILPKLFTETVDDIIYVLLLGLIAYIYMNLPTIWFVLFLFLVFFCFCPLKAGLKILFCGPQDSIVIYFVIEDVLEKMGRNGGDLEKNGNGLLEKVYFGSVSVIVRSDIWKVEFNRSFELRTEWKIYCERTLGFKYFAHNPSTFYP